MTSKVTFAVWNLSNSHKGKGKGKEEYLYSAFYILCISQSAQAWITVLPANTPCLPFLRKLSPDGVTPNRGKRSNCSLLLIYRPRRDERLSWPGWLTYTLGNVACAIYDKFIRLLQTFPNMIFRPAVQQLLTRFWLASRGPSAIAELVVHVRSTNSQPLTSNCFRILCTKILTRRSCSCRRGTARRTTSSEILSLECDHRDNEQ